MSEELKREARRVKNKIKQEFCGEFLVFLGEAMLNPGKITPENFMEIVSGRASHVRSKMANVDIGAEIGILINEKGEAVKILPVEEPIKKKPIKKVAVTDKKVVFLHNQVQEQLHYYEEGMCYMPEVKQKIEELFTKFASDNDL